jgi:hypothetical protein
MTCYKDSNLTNIELNMKNLWIIALVVNVLYSCNFNSENPSQSDTNLDEIMGKMGKSNIQYAKVLEFHDAGNYTYAKLDNNGTVFWAAITVRQLETGMTYKYAEGMVMKDFESKELGMVFDSVMFIEDFGDGMAKDQQSTPKTIPHDHTTTQAQKSIQVEPAKDGKTIADIFSNKKQINGSKVLVKGQVVKINKNIMKRNWIHIQDGTESGGNFDLTITSIVPPDFEVGDVLTFEGILNIDKDFGSGYKYDAILEDATWHKSDKL